MLIPSLPDSHLTYCLNVHPGRTMAEVEEAVFHHAATVRDIIAARRAIEGPFGVGLWLGADVACEMEQGDGIQRFADRLQEAGLYVPTLNGFPYGAFHGQRVKESVYSPDWSDPSRMEHTLRLARILAELLPEGAEGTISTLPITYRAWTSEGQPFPKEAVSNLLKTARGLQSLHETTGRSIRIALEPEPDCVLDDIASLGAFADHLVRTLSMAELDTFHDWIGICLDTAHAATLFEPLGDVLKAIRKKGLSLFKTQLAAVPEVPPEAKPGELLQPFSDDVYLHQTTLLDSLGLGAKRFADLPEALAKDRLESTWRTHYHVPFSWRPETALRTTADEVTPDFFPEAHAMGVRHFELEVYCLGLMLPNEESVHKMLADDLVWLLDRMG